MIKKAVLIPVVLSAIFYYGCSYQYGIANVGMESRSMPKPVYEDHFTNENYVSGRYYNSFNVGFNSDESFQFGDVFLSRGGSHSNFNYGFGAGVFLGQYYVSHIIDAPAWKDFVGFGAVGEFCFTVRFDDVTIDVWGARAALSFDRGPYPDFRSAIDDNQYDFTNMHPGNVALSFGGPFNIAYKIKDSKIGLYALYGFTLGNNIFLDGYLTISGTISYDHPLFSINAQHTRCYRNVKYNPAIPVYSIGMAFNL